MSGVLDRQQEKASRAARAGSVWGAVSTSASEGLQVEALQEKRYSATYRLRGAAPDGGSVIAKWLREGPCAIELAVYEDLLPKLPMPMLRCFGSMADDVNGYRWLFVQEADGAPYDSSDPSHRAMAARWLAVVHSSAMEAARRLMERGDLLRVGPAEALEQAASAGTRIASFIDNPFLSADDRDVLVQVIEQCRTTVACIDACERYCRVFPETLAHGDFVGKNFRVRGGGGWGGVLMVFDWEMAGYGPPAADVAECDDLTSYVDALTGPMGERSPLEIETLCLIGRLMRWSAAVDWASWSLEGQAAHKAMRKLRCYWQNMCELSRKIREAGLLS